MNFPIRIKLLCIRLSYYMKRSDNVIGILVSSHTCSDHIIWHCISKHSNFRGEVNFTMNWLYVSVPSSHTKVQCLFKSDISAIVIIIIIIITWWSSSSWYSMWPTTLLHYINTKLVNTILQRDSTLPTLSVLFDKYFCVPFVRGIVS